MRVGLMLLLLLEGIPPPVIASRQARDVIQQAYEAELEVIVALASPQDRAMLAKQRSSHWAKMLFPSRIYFDGSMSNLFRMDSSTIDALIRTVCPHLTTARNAPDAVLPPLRVAVFLYLCAQGSSLEATADRFAIGPSTVSGIVREVSAIVCREMQSLVSFPPLVETASQFMELCGVPQIVGCIDGSHIPIARPKVDGDMYYNRKCWYSVVLQAVVDWRGRFCDLDCKWPGRVGDSRVFRNSPLGQMFPSVSAASTSVMIPTGGDTFESVPIFLLGDSSYQNTNFLVTTFELAETEDAVCKDLNEHLSSARYKVECAFGQLKCRWRILLRGIELETTIAPDIVYALCIIQNFLMDCKDTVQFDSDEKTRSMKGYFHNHKWNLSLLLLTTCARN